MVNIVKRPFKSNGIYYTAGSLIDDPSVIRNFNTKVMGGKIIQVSKDSDPAIIKELEARFNIKINEKETTPIKTKEEGVVKKATIIK